MTTEQVAGLVRHGLTSAGGAVVMLGWVDEATMAEVVGAMMTLFGFGWSYWAKAQA